MVQEDTDTVVEILWVVDEAVVEAAVEALVLVVIGATVELVLVLDATVELVGKKVGSAAHWQRPYTMQGHQVCRVPDPQGAHCESTAA